MSSKPPKGKTPGKKGGKKSGSVSPRSPKAKKLSSDSSSPGSPKSRSPKSPKSKKSSPPSSPEPAKSLPPPLQPAPLKLCPTHLKPFKVYSELREELLCEDCQMRIGPTGQRLVPIEEAYRRRLAGLYNTLNTNLYAKKEMLTQQRGQLQLRLSQVREVKTVIEMDMKNEFNSMHERLNSAYKSKEAMLQHMCQELKFDLDRISNVTQTVERLNTDAVGFLMKAGELMNECESTLAKSYNEQISIDAEDLPKELPEVRRICEDSEPLRTLLSFKDEVIWRLRSRETPSQDRQAGVRQELVEWAKLTDRFSQELNRLRLACEYCGCVLEESNVNGNCSKGRGGRHNFVKQAKSPPSVFATMKTPPERDGTSSLIQLLSTRAAERRIDLEKVLRSKDTNDTGTVKDTDLYQILISMFSFTEAQAAQLVDRFDFNQTGATNYGNILREVQGVQTDPVREKVRGVMEKLRAKDKKQSGVISEQKLKNALLKAEMSSEDVQRVLQAAERSSEGEVRYRESLLKWLEA